MTEAQEHPPRTRRPPPAFRRVTVGATTWLSPRLIRITLTGTELQGFVVEEPGASVRLLIPASNPSGLVIPTWNGNEFLLADGRRPTLRTLTPRRVRTNPPQLDVDIVLHEGGAAARWAIGATAGAPAAVSGPGRGYTVDRDAPAFLLAGDETAIPAIGQLLENLPDGVPAQVHIEVARPDARVALPHHTTACWHDLAPAAAPGDALVAAIKTATILPGTRIWVAGEAAGVQRIRRHLFEERMIPRGHTSIRGYWKHGGNGDPDGGA